MNIRVINKSNNELPSYKFFGDSGMDVRANVGVPIVLSPGERCVVPTGLYFQIPPGYEIQVRPRSGLAIKYGITVLNTPGTVDSNYTGELKVILYNSGSEDFLIETGDRIAQIVPAEVPVIEWTEVTEFTTDTNRGSGGFGHTGIK